jgi:hypothetical protein
MSKRCGIGFSNPGDSAVPVATVEPNVETLAAGALDQPRGVVLGKGQDLRSGAFGTAAAPSSFDPLHD